MSGTNPKVSILIPSRNEKFLSKTVEDLLNKAQGEVEIIIVMDGYWEAPIDDPRVHVIHRGAALGMRAGINAAAALAKGRYLLKTDGHCMWDEGYDIKLAADCEADWVVVPRRKRLDPENWTFTELHKPDIDYMYLGAPTDPNDWGGAGLNGKPWNERNADPALKEVLIDDLMSAQGSAWFMHKDYFYFLELMDETHYGTFWNEFQEIGLKCWLSGGEVKVNKKTWYAHLHKGKKYGRGYFLNEKELQKGSGFTKKWLTNSAWNEKQIHPLSWLIEKFSPVPTWNDEMLAKLKETEQWQSPSQK